LREKNLFLDSVFAPGKAGMPALRQSGIAGLWGKNIGRNRDVPRRRALERKAITANTIFSKGSLMASKLIATIDREECTSCGQCWDICPDFFEQSSDDDFSQIVEEYRIGGNLAKGEVPEELEEEVKEATDACPVEIIHVDEKG